MICSIFSSSTVTPSPGADASGAGNPPAAAELCWWSFDEDGEGVVIDAAGGKRDPVHGGAGHVTGVSGKAIKLDGFRSHVKRENFGAGMQAATLSVNGRPWERGTDFRQGIRRGTAGDDLIVWLRLEAQSPVETVLGRE